MNTTTRLSFEEFLRLPEAEGVRYELNEGELVMEPSPTFRHNRIRNRIARHLSDFVEQHRLGEITVETDFRLSSDVVRNPDVAFVTAEQLRTFDIDRSPIEGSPALAVEVISPSNSAQDVLAKVHQYLAAGSRAVWVVYPTLRLVEIHEPEGIREIRKALLEDKPFGGIKFRLPFTAMFDEDLAK